MSTDHRPEARIGWIAECLRRSLRFEQSGAGERTAAARFVAPSVLQGPRDVTHGGAVAALLVEAARRHALEAGRGDLLARAIEADISLNKELRVDTDVGVVSERNADDEFAVRVERGDGQVIATARVRVAASEVRDEGEGREALAVLQADSRAPALNPAPQPHPSGAPSRGGDPGRFSDEVPGTVMCLACGLHNPVGLRLRFRVHSDFVWRRLHPPLQFCDTSGALFHAFASVALDEIGWWLGALRFGGCGLTTRLELAWDPAAAESRDSREPLFVAGARRATERADARGRYWTSRASLLAPNGRTVASARVLFAGSHAYTRAMLEDLAAGSDRAAVTRIFPSLVV